MLVKNFSDSHAIKYEKVNLYTKHIMHFFPVRLPGYRDLKDLLLALLLNLDILAKKTVAYWIVYREQRGVPEKIIGVQKNN